MGKKIIKNSVGRKIAKGIVKAAKGVIKAVSKKPRKTGSSKATTSKVARPKYDESVSADWVRKDYLIRRINERIASVVRNAGVNNEEVMRWQAKLTRSNSPFISKTKIYDPSKMRTAKNAKYGEVAEYQLLSRGKKDIEKMDYNALLRLDEQTRGWGQVKAEAKKELLDQARMEQEMNPFIPADQRPSITDTITEADIIEYINQKEVVRDFIEGNSEAFYALIESTGWDDIRAHTTEEIYQKVSKLDIKKYKFKNTTTKIGKDYIKRRDASRERRRQLGI